MSRPSVLVITEHWGEDGDEATVATRLVAGALARRADVAVVHLLAGAVRDEMYQDSVFHVHEVALKGARPLRAAIVRAAIGQARPLRRVPPPLARHLAELQGHAGSIRHLLESLRPDAIVLAGYRQSFDIADLGERDNAGRARVVFLPLCEDLSELLEPSIAELIEASDAIGAANPADAEALATAYPGRDSDVFALDLALALNRSATTQGLFGVRFFGRYVLLLRSFPPGGPRYANTLTHELLRSVLGDVAVAEVDGEKWRISDAENTLELPVNPTRVNLWRLMAHALFSVDLRPQGPLGREALESMLLSTPVIVPESTSESMLLSTPVIVPESTSAAAHVQAASGGLWYRDAGELLDAARALMDEDLRGALARQAGEYARTHHGAMDRFVDRIGDAVLGEVVRA